VKGPRDEECDEILWSKVLSKLISFEYHADDSVLALCEVSSRQSSTQGR
jgi:hypothetical protein